MAAKIDYSYLVSLRRNNPAWRLLCAESAPLALSFFNSAFIEENVREMAETDLAEKLEDELYRLRDELGEEEFPRPAREYIREWSEPEKGWLRRFYREGDDEPFIDLTPSVEKAVSWVKSLEQNVFVGTESRLKIIFELLRQITEETNEDRASRIEALEKRKAEIDAEIECVKGGKDYLLDDTAVRDRFQQFASMARELLSDFREVEFNFRALDRDIRKRIAISSSPKGELLDGILGSADQIEESDQGKSFSAFMDFLLSSGRREEFDAMLEKTFKIKAIAESGYDRRLERVYDAWLEASFHTRDARRMISAQLRRFLDGRAWLENRRIFELIGNITRFAAESPERAALVSMEIDEPGINVDLPMERPLFVPPSRTALLSDNIEVAEGADEDVLFDTFYVDEECLAQNIDEVLRGKAQASLAQVVEMFPIRQGLAEVLGYLGLAAESDSAFVDESAQEVITWITEAGAERRARLPRVVFAKAGSGAWRAAR